MTTRMKILRIIYLLLMILDVVTVIPWAVTIMSGITAVPFALTITLFVMHLKSFRQIKQRGAVSRRLMTGQLIVGGLLAACVAFLIGFLSSLDCLDVCTGVPAYTGYLYGGITFVVCMVPAALVYVINRGLQPYQTPPTPSSNAPVPPVSIAPTPPDATIVG